MQAHLALHPQSDAKDPDLLPLRLRILPRRILLVYLPFPRRPVLRQYRHKHRHIQISPLYRLQTEVGDSFSTVHEYRWLKYCIKLLFPIFLVLYTFLPLSNTRSKTKQTPKSKKEDLEKVPTYKHVYFFLSCHVHLVVSLFHAHSRFVAIVMMVWM